MEIRRDTNPSHPGKHAGMMAAGILAKKQSGTLSTARSLPYFLRFKTTAPNGYPQQQGEPP